MLLLYAAVVLTLGFLLAWVAALVSREEIEVKTGVITLFCAWIIGIIAEVSLSPLLKEHAQLAIPMVLVVNYLILAFCLKAVAKLPWKAVFIIAAIYDVILIAAKYGISAALNAP